MCARIDQNETPRHYALAFRWTAFTDASQAQPLFNVSPGTARPVLHVADGEQRIDDLFWGYRPAWAMDKIPVAANARLEKLNQRYWAPLFAHGRVIVPADGWYEWTGGPKDKQPWHIHLKSRQPLFLAGIASVGPAGEHPAESGFVIITYGAEGSLVDLHSRRPLVFDADSAALWLDPHLSHAQADTLAHEASLQAELFDWYPVDKALGNVRNQGAQLARPVSQQSSPAPVQAGFDFG
ncbi:SOS response-associated peptidase [Massilia sp. TS11]|uniref:SOS response-associated peptidase n=1 Tax=Massilia sp. TS11 TaxID=2908003 RepID=UPI001EDBA2AA|nr:SOS response-associated peptidase family protein [Massilia sp. TS11]MCG2584219.1 SOS response-associated peptidase family protein [Massilia sp. TS11]